MKLFISTLVALALIIATEIEKVSKDAAEVNTVAHFVPATEASFGYASPYYLDIDKDGTNDFSFQTVSFGENGTVNTEYLVYPMNDNEVMHVEGSAAITEAGETITGDLKAGNLSWSEEPAEIIESSYDGNTMKWNGTWSGGRDQYLGIKLVKDGRSYLGWVRIEVSPETEKAYITDYAINRSAGQQLVTSI